LVQSDIPAVVAMQSEISDRAAAVFASGFYQPLAAGSPVDASVSAARLAMLADHSDDIEWGTPVLFMRVPDGRIFDLADQGDRTVRAFDPAAGSGRGAGSTEVGPRVFINYRRADTSGHALLITDRLAQRFGRERIDLADDHGSAGDRLAQVHGAGAFLALIGPDWLSSLRNSRPAGRGEDLARREIEWALRDRPRSVVPVLIDASMPDPEAVPRSLRGLCRLQPSVVRHATFEQDLAALAARVERIAGDAGERQDVHPHDVDPSAASAAARLLAIPPTRVPAPSGIPQPYPDHYVDLVTSILTGTVVPVLGPRVGQKSPAVAHLNSLLAEPVGSSSGELAEVAQRVAVTLGERRLYSEIMQLAAAQSEPTEVHHFLAQLPGPSPAFRSTASPPADHHGKP
jgi:hypothetical protein